MTAPSLPAKGAPCPSKPVVDSGMEANEGLVVTMPPYGASEEELLDCIEATDGLGATEAPTVGETTTAVGVEGSGDRESPPEDPVAGAVVEPEPGAWFLLSCMAARAACQLMMPTKVPLRRTSGPLVCRGGSSKKGVRI